MQYLNFWLAEIDDPDHERYAVGKTRFKFYRT